MSKNIVIDLETTIHNKVGSNKASPHSPDNRIVDVGVDYLEGGAIFVKRRSNLPLPIDTGLLVGQNIKFDLTYLRYAAERHDMYTDILRTVKIWDIQLAEYILTEQESTYASLDQMSLKYGFPVKDDYMSKAWAAGVSTEDIPEIIVHPYCAQDIANTREIAKIQMQAAYERGLLPLMGVQMDALLATTEMEYNGLHVDQEALMNLSEDTERRLRLHESNLREHMLNSFGDFPVADINPNSKAQLSALLFGGELKYKKSVSAGFYKNGREKFKKEVTIQYVNAWFDADKLGIEKTKSGIYKTSEDVVNSLIGHIAETKAILADLQAYIYLQKQYSTYCLKTNALVYPDGKIHHSLNHCVTRTGRLSSTNPNLQNASSKGDVRIKRVFTSRFGDDGLLVEMDYSQLEVICLAHLSQDPVLIKDLQDGVDLHDATGWEVYGSGYKMTKEERRVVKGVNFGLIYGGGVATLSKQTGAPETLVKAIIDAFYTRYSTIKVRQQERFALLLSSRQSSSKYTKLGYPAGRGTLLSSTGRGFHFYEYDNAYKSKWNTEEVKFSPTEVKNNEVQGFATGDIVPMVMGQVYRALRARKDFDGKVLMINTVHDSLLFDIHNDNIDEAIPMIKGIMENAPQMLKDIFNIDFKMKLKVGVTVGSNWEDMTELDI